MPNQIVRPSGRGFRVFRAAVCMALVLMPSAVTGQIDMVVIPPPKALSAGDTAAFTVLIHNPDDSDVTYQLPASLPGTLKYGANTMAVILIADPPRDGEEDIPLAPGATASRAFTLIVPEGLVGRTTLQIAEPETEVVFLVQNVTKPTEEKAPAPDPVTYREDRDDLLAGNFFGHEPVYFIVGSDPTHSKFQISFKYRLLNPEGPIAKSWDRATNFYFGYTQTSFWDWESDSAPFVDSSYKPELFYFRPNISQSVIPNMDTFDFQTGLMHESNGRDGAESRSLNIVYLKTKGRWGRPSEPNFTVAPRILTYVGDLSDNPDIATYRGHFDFEVAYTDPEHWKISALTRIGTGAHKGSFQVDASYPLSRFLLKNLDLYFYAQYFTGYAETLLFYDQNYSFLRAGFAVYR